MFDKLFSPETIEETLRILQTEIPLACWETVYVTILATAFAVVIGLPLGVLLVVGEKDGVRPLPKGVMHVLNVIINLLRSVPFLILMIMVFPLTRLIVGTAVGTVASIVPLVIAAVSLCGPSGGRKPSRGEPEYHRDGPEHGRFSVSDYRKGTDSGECAFSGFQFHHCDYHDSRLFGHERYHWRRRTGKNCHQLRLLSV